MSASQSAVAATLLDRHGTTYAREAGITLKDTPQPLYQLLVLSSLLSARIRASVAVDAARALFHDGMRNPRAMADASWQNRVDALGEGGYRRYDERTATQLGDGAELLLEEHRGDLRRVREEAHGDEKAVVSGLRETPGMGPTGADIFLREAQAVWPEFAPHFDGKALRGAERLGLPQDPERLERLAGDAGPAVLAAALVRAALRKKVADDVLEHAG
ncbi:MULTISPECIES: endonuclease [Streptomyces diastaticus group]|uniref:Endonuclease n=1 Tax=Streptomyces gougerotii TaxID=53448 RepID=A0A8H9LRV2_9ACTN|nr:endonuclease [Streptomyces gougerotii]GFH80171.1 endonuclease [Streptomyces gougerotii]GGU77325.1 endonuclease [Streptomyces gougerotii]